MWLDKKDDNELKTPLPTTSVGAGGSQTVGDTTATPGTTGTSTATQKTPNRFATVQDYLKNNQPQSEDLGQKFTSQLDTTFGQQKGAIDTAANQAKSDIATNTVAFNPELINEAKTTPTAITGNQNKLGEFMKQYNASYSGPQNLEATTGYTNAANTVNKAKEIQGQLGTEGGREQLLQDQFNVYGQGNKGLDQALLQESSVFPKVQEQQKQFGTVQDYLNAQSQDVTNKVKEAQAQTAATKTKAQGALANNLTEFQNDINARTKAAQDAATQQANSYTKALQSGDAAKISEALKTSNLTDAQKSNLIDYLMTINKSYGSSPDLSNYYTVHPMTDINAANVASKADYDKAAAYNQLTGVDYSGVLNPADIAKAGTAVNPNTGINATDAQQALRAYLIQKEKESLAPQPTGTPGSSTPGTSKPGTLETGGTLDKLAGGALTGGLGTNLGVSGITSGIEKLGTKISDSLGFGAGKKDAVVNLPELKLPDMAIPATANAATTKAITDVYNKPLSTAGSYHEGAVGDMITRLDTLRTALRSGQISKDEYNAYAIPLAKWTQQALGSIMSAGSTAANSVKSGYNTFVANDYLTPATDAGFKSPTNTKSMRAF